jgi:hypothetical protein
MEKPPTAPVMDPEGTERESDPNEIRRGIRMGGEDGKSREQVRYERLIEQVEPTLKGTVERLPQYVALFERALINDTRIFPAKVEAKAAEDGAIVLTGYVGFEENKDALGNIFKYLGFENVRNEVEVLPSRDLGERKYALVVEPIAFTFDKPTEPRERMNQAFIGDAIFLLKQAENDQYLVQTNEGYVGYIAGSALRPVDAGMFRDYQQGEAVYLRKNYQVEGMTLPQGTRLKGLGKKVDGRVAAQLPTGKEVMIPEEIVDVKSGEVDQTVQDAIVQASQIEGSKYVWGGKSSEGVDCSGLVQSAYKALGVNLARDAYQQAYNGNLVATRWYRDGMRAGDLMYFLGGDGRIHHTAIYVGDGKFIEASGTVKYTSLNPGDANYSERRDKSFAFAKRIIE